MAIRRIPIPIMVRVRWERSHSLICGFLADDFDVKFMLMLIIAKRQAIYRECWAEN